MFVLALVLTLGLAPPREVRVVVRDAITRAGLPEAAIEYALGDESELPQTTPGRTRRILTGTGGEATLMIEPGHSRLALFVGYPGYRMRNRGETVWDVSARTAETTIEVLMDPAASMSGRLVDSRTRRPLPGFVIQAFQYAPVRHGMRIVMTSKPATSDGDGRFAIGGLLPGPYGLQLEPPQSGTRLLAGSPAPELIGKVPVPLGYPAGHWPADRFLDIAGETHLGNIELREQRLPSLYGRLMLPEPPESGCFYQPDLLTQDTQASRRQVVTSFGIPCSQGFRIDNALPGAYLLRARVINAVSRQTTGVVQQDVFVPDNQEHRYPQKAEVRLIPLAPVAAEGRVVLDSRTDEALPSRLTDTLKLYIHPSWGGSQDTAIHITTWTQDGGFRFHWFPAEEYQVTVVTPPGFVFTGLNYNGVRVTDPDRLRLDGRAIHHGLRVEISSRPASLSGRLEEASETKRPLVALLLKSSAIDPDAEFFERIVSVAGNGSFAFAELPPGDYLLIVAPPDTISQRGRPGQLALLAFRAKAVRLAEGERRQVTIRAEQ